MAKIERVYNIPLRKEWLRAPHYKRAKRAISAVRTFLKRHMKSDIKNIKLGLHLNEAIWDRGIKYQPHHVKVTVIKNDEGIVRAELHGFEIQEPKSKKEKGAIAKLKEKITGTKEEKAAAKTEGKEKEEKIEAKQVKERVEVKQKTEAEKNEETSEQKKSEQKEALNLQKNEQMQGQDQNKGRKAKRNN